MSNYEVIEFGDSKKILTHLALSWDCNPTRFEVVVKEAQWQKAIDEEIVAIERNNT